MRFTATAMAVATLAALLGAGWAAGCTGLSDDCALNLTCPPAASSSSGGGTGGGVSCIGVFTAGACNTCLQNACCQPIIDCEEDAHCIYCLTSTIANDPLCASAATQETYNTLVSCQALDCAAICGAQDTCNPVTNAGCAAGARCELNPNVGAFRCSVQPGSVVLCGVCAYNGGPFCEAGMRCYDSHCARFCCDDGDCGGGVCELDPLVAFGMAVANPADKVGLCLTTLVPDGGSSSAACNAPATSPSKGACVAGYTGM